MAHAIWQGNISFGLVTIPVTLHTAEKPDDLDLDLLDARDFAPVGYKKINKRTGRAIESDNIVRGYEVSSGQYVVIEDEDLRAANVKSTQTVDIVGFIDAGELEPIMYDRPYYLSAKASGAKGYALLRDALRDSKKLGIARVVLRTRAYVAALYPRGDALVLHLLRYAHELKDAKDLELPGKRSTLGVTARELAMAEKLIEGLEMEWSWPEYRDEYRDDLLAMIKKKAKGARPVAELPEEEESKDAEVVDLMSLLKKSLEKPASKPRARPKTGASTRKRSRATKSTSRRRKAG